MTNPISKTIVIHLTPRLKRNMAILFWSIVLTIASSFGLNYKAFVSPPPTTMCSSDLPLSLNVDDSDYKNTQKIATQISKRYDVDKAFATEVVNIAKGYSYKDFPTIHDILSIIGIESGFNPSNEYKGAFGLMQIEYLSHKREVTKLADLYDISTNIQIGVKTLRQYYSMLRDKDSAILAYNIGIGSFLEGKRSEPYLERYKKEIKHY